MSILCSNCDLTTGIVLDTRPLILLGRIEADQTLPSEPLITAVTLTELSVGPLVAGRDEERAARRPDQRIEPESPATLLTDNPVDWGALPEVERTDPVSGRVVSGRSGTRFVVSPPFAEDAAGIEGPVSVDLTGGVLTYSLDEKWASDPARVWPVRIDPTVTVSGSGDVVDCFVSEAFGSGSFCSSSELKAGVDANGDERRSVIKFPNLDTVIPYLDTVYDAELRLFSHADTGGAAIELQASAVTEAWDTNVSWVNRDASNTWTTAGGTVDSTTPLYVDAAGSYTDAGGWVTPTGADILFVAGGSTLTSKDQLVRDRLVAQGHSVTVRDDDVVTAADADGRDLVIVSSSVVYSKIGNMFRNTSTPVLTWEAYIFGDMELTGASYLNRGETSSYQSQVTITDPNHPMAAGLSGTVTVATANSKFSWGASLPSGAEQVATLATDSSKSVIFAYQKGDSMDGGFTAPGARVAMFPNYFTPSYMTAEGWELWDAAVTWALDPANNGNSTSAGSVLFVAGNTSPLPVTCPPPPTSRIWATRSPTPMTTPSPLGTPPATTWWCCPARWCSPRSATCSRRRMCRCSRGRAGCSTTWR